MFRISTSSLSTYLNSDLIDLLVGLLHDKIHHLANLSVAICHFQYTLHLKNISVTVIEYNLFSLRATTNYYYYL